MIVWTSIGTIALVAFEFGMTVLWSYEQKAEDPRILKHDSIEDDSNMRAILAAAGLEAVQLIADAPPEDRKFLAYCSHAYVKNVWALKKRILKEKYGVEWRTPLEMNPRLRY